MPWLFSNNSDAIELSRIDSGVLTRRKRWRQPQARRWPVRSRPGRKYSIGIFGNERFSGLEMVCLMRVALDRINPDAETGIDFGDAWNAAKMMHAAKIAKKTS